MTMKEFPVLLTWVNIIPSACPPYCHTSGVKPTYQETNVCVGYVRNFQPWHMYPIQSPNNEETVVIHNTILKPPTANSGIDLTNLMDTTRAQLQWHSHRNGLSKVNALPFDVAGRNKWPLSTVCLPSPSSSFSWWAEIYGKWLTTSILLQLEVSLNFQQMKEDLNSLTNGRRPQFFGKSRKENINIRKSRLN